jgi:tetratricopeptide (TPR) repeat protein
MTTEAESWAALESDASSTMAVDPETLAMLHALGYSAGDPNRPAGEGRGNPVELMPVHEELQVVGEMLATGRPRDAVDRLEGAIVMDPENLAALRDLSRAFTMLGRLDEAAAAAARARAVAPWSAQAAIIEADVEYRRGRYQRALELIDHALELDDRSLEARLERCRCLAALGRSEEARAGLSTLLEESPDNSWVALRQVEIVELPSGDFTAAEQRLRTVLGRNPRFSEAWLLLGTVHMDAGQPAQAIAVYREAVEQGASGGQIRARLALLLKEAGDPAAETALREAILSNQTPQPELYVRLGELFIAQGRRQEAQQQFELAVESPAPTTGSMNSKATAMMHLGRQDEAEMLWQGMTRTEPDFWRAWLNLASLAVQRQQWTDAEKYARSALDLEPTSAGAWNNLGIALEELGRTDEAEAAYRRGAEADTRDWRALFNLGILLRVHSRYDEAEIVQYQVLDRFPAHGGAHFELGVLCAGPLNDPERAKKHLQASIGADPDHPRAKQALIVLDQLP